MLRLFPWTPVNAIWEGSGNIECLDALFAKHTSPEALEAYFAEAGLARARADPSIAVSTR